MAAEDFEAKWSEIILACEEYGDDPYPAWLAFLINHKQDAGTPPEINFVIKLNFLENYAVTGQASIPIYA